MELNKEHNLDHNTTNEGGFSLVELAVAITAIGVLMAGTMTILDSMRAARLKLDTEQKMATIADALSTYAQTHHRLPCPASPIRQNVRQGGTTQAMHFGDERKLSPAGVADINRAGNCFSNRADSHGIVPFRALGLEEHFARDAWGRYFTFVISPVFARYNYVNTIENTVNRNVVHYLTTSSERSQIPKFRFCHTMNVAQQADGTGTHNTDTDAQDLRHVYGPGELYRFSRNAEPEVIGSGTLPDRLFALDHRAGNNEHTQAIAFALISHGENKSRAYMGNETNNQFTTFNMGTPERRNGRNSLGGLGPNNVVYNLDYSEGNNLNTRFDDLVMVMTQDQIYSRKGGQSCVTP